MGYLVRESLARAIRRRPTHSWQPEERSSASTNSSVVVVTPNGSSHACTSYPVRRERIAGGWVSSEKQHRFIFVAKEACHDKRKKQLSPLRGGSGPRSHLCQDQLTLFFVVCDININVMQLVRLVCVGLKISDMRRQNADPRFLSLPLCVAREIRDILDPAKLISIRLSASFQFSNVVYVIRVAISIGTILHQNNAKIP